MAADEGAATVPKSKPKIAARCESALASFTEWNVATVDGGVELSRTIQEDSQWVEGVTQHLVTLRGSDSSRDGACEFQYTYSHQHEDLYDHERVEHHLQAVGTWSAGSDGTTTQLSGKAKITDRFIHKPYSYKADDVDEDECEFDAVLKYRTRSGEVFDKSVTLATAAVFRIGPRAAKVPYHTHTLAHRPAARIAATPLLL